MQVVLPQRRERRSRPEPSLRTKGQLGKPCAYCSEPMQKPSRDHVIPRSRGYTLSNNKIWCCEPCNRHKGARTLEEWLEVLKKQPGKHAKRIECVGIIVAARLGQQPTPYTTY